MAATNNDWKMLLKKWNLSQFEKEFEKNGWDDPDDWDEMNEQDLIELGLKKGHRVRFMKNVKKLKVEENVNDSTTNPTNTTNTTNTSSSTQQEGIKNDSNPGPVLRGGDAWIELGQFRLGIAGNTDHWSVSHKTNKKTAVIFRGDGTIHPGPRSDFGLWDKPYISGLRNVSIGDGYIQFGQHWKIGICDNDHFSISHLSKKTCMIWRSDGTRHKGPRTDFNNYWNRDKNSNHFKTFAVDSKDNDPYVKWIQFGTNWRIGQHDFGHFSISANRVYFTYGNINTAVIYRRDGTIHAGPRKDFGLWKDKQNNKLTQMTL